MVEETPRSGSVPIGRKRIAVIGIDRYRSWPVLDNAVRDARGALRLFEYLGFELIGQPLLDESATGAAIQALVTDDLMALGPDDSLVVFFAGHGSTRRHWRGSEEIKTGYLIPVDAAHGDKVATWIDLEDWLRKIARLQPRHVLVIIDACNAGIALSVKKWRDSGMFDNAALPALQARYSRRIITSALDDQVASDSGPVSGHSLFTGCLIEGFMQRRLGQERGVITGMEIGLYLQQRVGNYPDSRQTPDFGTFEGDDRGEMVIPLPTEVFDRETPTRASQTVSLAIVSVATSGRTVRNRSRPRRIATAVALVSIALAASFALLSSFRDDPASIQPPAQAAAAPGAAANIERDAKAAEADTAAAPANHDATESSTDGELARSGSGSGAAAGDMPLARQPAGSSGVAGKSRVAPSNKAGTATRPRAPSPADAVPKALVSPDSAQPTPDANVAKRRVRAPPNRGVKPAVDENDCPVKGTRDVDIQSYPPGATIYINRKACGVLGVTPWRGKLPPSAGTRTGKFTAILERTGEQPVAQDFEVAKSTRLNRVEVHMVPTP